MKKIAKLCVALLSVVGAASAFAAKPGAYAGLGLGLSKQETTNQYLFSSSSPYTTQNQSKTVGGLGGRLFAGYNFNEYAGVEAGFAHYAKSKYRSTLVSGSLSDTTSRDYTMNTVDVVGKAYLPISDSGFNVYALGGAALVHSQSKINVSQGSNGFSVNNVGTKTTNKIRPEIGLGASYDIPNTQLTSNIEFSHIQGSGNLKTSASAIPSANMLTLNLAYNFE